MQPAARLIWTLALLSLTLASAAAEAAKLYRWTDADGNVHYSDKIPVEASGQGRTELNKRGLEIDQVAPAKTKEEFEKERALELLRKEQEALILEQKKKDRALLRSYRSEGDIVMARDGKLAAIDTSKKVIESNIRLTKTRLDDMQRRAAVLERQGKPLGKDLESGIETTWKRLEQEYAGLVTRERDKDAVREEYDGYLERFRRLKNIRGDQEQAGALPDKAPELETVATCQGGASCDGAWRRAKAYRALHSTTAAQISADTIVTSMPPGDDTDISITVSRLKLGEGDEEQLFLDVQCKQTPVGNEFCHGDKAEAVRQGFRPFLSQ
jgi:hypothetical protein